MIFFKINSVTTVIENKTSSVDINPFDKAEIFSACTLTKINIIIHKKDKTMKKNSAINHFKNPD